MRSWALASLLLGLACCCWLAVADEQDEPSTRITCNGTELTVDPPLFARMIEDEAHFTCSPRYQLKGQSILTCFNRSWDHKIPVCEEIPRTMIKMICPYNHSLWTLDNLDNITSWISHNSDHVIILDDEYISDSIMSKRSAAEMLARFNDPFFRFYGKLTTYDKGVSIKLLIEKFKQSSEFRKLVRTLENDEFEMFDGNSIETDENVLVKYYGNFFELALAEVIRPYKGLIDIREDDSSHISDTLLGASAVKETLTPILPDSDPPSSLDVNPQFQALTFDDNWVEPTIDPLNVFSTTEDTFSMLEKINDEQSDASLSRKNRQRGDADKLLPPKAPENDYFGRELNQVLTGTKAQTQEKSLRESYLSHLRIAVEHIIRYNLPKKDWPTFLQAFEIEELIHILQITTVPGPTPTPKRRCPDPRELGYDLVKNGRALMQASDRVIIDCNIGYVLKGPQELYCDTGAWVPLGSAMPQCIVNSLTCDAPTPIIQNAIIRSSTLDSVQFECLPGFVIRGSDTMYCENNRWIPAERNSPPYCLEASASECPPPRNPRNGVASEPHYLSDGKTLVVRYFCDRGFSLQGHDSSICVNGEWVRPSPVCTTDIEFILSEVKMPPRLPKCPLLEIANGRVGYYDDGRLYARIFCKPGDRLIGPGQVMCVNGTYQGPTPRCESSLSIHCPPASIPANGNVTYITNSAIRYTCNPGFRTEGKAQTTCYQGVWMDPPPRCVQIIAGGCDPREPARGSNVIVFAYSNGRWFECSNRHEIVGSKIQFCNNGIWGPEPKCLVPPGSEIKPSVVYDDSANCPLPTVVDSELEIFSRGREIHYRCKQREFTLEGPARNKCPETRWLNAPPRCRGYVIETTPLPRPQPQRGCSPRPIRGGDGYVYSEGRVIYYQCRTGYAIKGFTTLHCERSNWIEDIPSCVPESSQRWPTEFGEIYQESSSCSVPLNYPGSVLTLADKGRRAIYSCSDGSRTEKRCSIYRWDGMEPTCNGGGFRSGVCEPLEVINGRFIQYTDVTAYIQCNPNFVLVEYVNTTGLRSKRTLCNSDTGRWDIGLQIPRCVPEPANLKENRPVEELQSGSNVEEKLHVPDCPPPEISPMYTYYILNDGRDIALGCQQKRMKRSVGQMICRNSIWEYTNKNSSTCEFECGLGDQKLTNGQYYVYNGNEFVFQCRPGYNLVGTSVAYCPDYKTGYTGQNTRIAVLNKDFQMPVCELFEGESRPIFDGEKDDVSVVHYSNCRWLQKFGDNKPSDYFIYTKGNQVDYKVNGNSTSVLCENGDWTRRDIHRSGSCTNFPVEPDHGTFFIYQDVESDHVYYYQCNTGYKLIGNPVRECSVLTTPAPICERDVDQFSSTLSKSRNPNFRVNSCPPPLAQVTSGHVILQSSGEIVNVQCRPGYVIEGTRSSSEQRRCESDNRWHSIRKFPATVSWPRCVRGGERQPISTGRKDYFGNPLPQELLGEKAARQEVLLQQQFRDHALQLAQFGRERVKLARQQGIPLDSVPRVRMPMSLSLTAQERAELNQRYRQVYDEVEQILNNAYSEALIRRRRKNHPDEADSDGLAVIPTALQEFATAMKENNFSQEDVNLMLMMDHESRVNFIKDKKNAKKKAKDDPKQSLAFVKKAFSLKDTKFKKTKTVQETSTEHTSKENQSMATTENPALTSTVATTTLIETNTSPIASEAPLAETTTSEETTTNEKSVEESTQASTNVYSEGSTENPPEASKESSTESPLPAVNTEKKKGYDLTCAYDEREAPEIEKGFVLSYELLQGPEGLIVQANYRCLPKYRFEFNNTSSLKCKNGGWVGERPKCVIDEDELDEDEDEEDEEEAVDNEKEKGQPQDELKQKEGHNFGENNSLTK